MAKKNDKKDKKKSAVSAKKKPAAKPVKKAAPAKKAAKAAPKKAAAKKVASKKAAKPQPAARPAAKKIVEKPVKAAKVAKPAPEKSKKEREVKKTEPEVVVEASEEIVEVAETETEAEEVVLTDAEGRRYCRVKDCDQLASVDSYCRYHYLLFWKKIQVRKKILSEGKLERYIEELTARYPDKFLDMLRKDLRSEKEFLAAIQELEIDESAVDNEFEDEAQTYIDEVRGIGETGGGREEEDF